jgi:threonine/homoserine/homoserine lactone efflux protein
LLPFCAGLGIGTIRPRPPAIMQAMNWGGVRFPLWLAWRIATAELAPTGRGGEPVGFHRTALFQSMNPKGWLVAVGAAGTFLNAHSGDRMVQAAWLGALFFAAAFPSGSRLAFARRLAAPWAMPAWRAAATGSWAPRWQPRWRSSYGRILRERCRPLFPSQHPRWRSAQASRSISMVAWCTP